MAAEREPAESHSKAAAEERSADGETLLDLERSDVVSWSADDVQTWLRMNGIDEICTEFAVGRIDGRALLNIDEGFLREQLDVRTALVRRKFLRCLKSLRQKQADRMRDKTVEQMDEYVARVESHRLHLVAKLKTVFDKFSSKAAGASEDRLDGAQLEQALLYLNRPVDSAQVNDWISDVKSKGRGVTFSEFVMAYSSLFAGRKLQEGPEINYSDAPPSKRTAKKQKYAEEAKALWDGDDEVEEEHKMDVTNLSALSENVLDVEVLAELKAIYDRFSVDKKKITPSEACQALTEAGVATPRREMAKYLRSQRHVLMERSIDFYEFIRAFAVLKGETSFPKRPTRDIYVRSSSDSRYGRGYSTSEKSVKSLRPETRPLPKGAKRLHDECNDSSEYCKGDRVRARYRGRSVFYPGRISRVRGDGSYDIDYDDGEKESGVRAELIRSLGGRSSSPKKGAGKGDESDSEADGALEVGTRVEARYKGRSKYYPGRISRERSDGTYDIDYDDGEKETGVSSDLIKGVGKKSRGRGDAFEEGDRVEAQYKGRSKFYPGRISRVRGDGSYDIDYDDGEKESGVRVTFIKSLSDKYGKMFDVD